VKENTNNNKNISVRNRAYIQNTNRYAI